MHKARKQSPLHPTRPPTPPRRRMEPAPKDPSVSSIGPLSISALSGAIPPFDWAPRCAQSPPRSPSALDTSALCNVWSFMESTPRTHAGFGGEELGPHTSGDECAVKESNPPPTQHVLFDMYGFNSFMDFLPNRMELAPEPAEGTLSDFFVDEKEANESQGGKEGLITEKKRSLPEGERVRSLVLLFGENTNSARVGIAPHEVPGDEVLMWPSISTPLTSTLINRLCANFASGRRSALTIAHAASCAAAAEALYMHVVERAITVVRRNRFGPAEITLRVAALMPDGTSIDLLNEDREAKGVCLGIHPIIGCAVASAEEVVVGMGRHGITLVQNALQVATRYPDSFIWTQLLLQQNLPEEESRKNVLLSTMQVILIRNKSEKFEHIVKQKEDKLWLLFQNAYGGPTRSTFVCVVPNMAEPDSRRILDLAEDLRLVRTKSPCLGDVQEFIDTFDESTLEEHKPICRVLKHAQDLLENPIGQRASLFTSDSDFRLLEKYAQSPMRQRRMKQLSGHSIHYREILVSMPQVHGKGNNQAIPMLPKWQSRVEERKGSVIAPQPPSQQQRRQTKRKFHSLRHVSPLLPSSLENSAGNTRDSASRSIPKAGNVTHMPNKDFPVKEADVCARTLQGPLPKMATVERVACLTSQQQIQSLQRRRGTYPARTKEENDKVAPEKFSISDLAKPFLAKNLNAKRLNHTNVKKETRVAKASLLRAEQKKEVTQCDKRLSAISTGAELEWVTSEGVVPPRRKRSTTSLRGGKMFKSPVHLSETHTVSECSTMSSAENEGTPIRTVVILNSDNANAINPCEEDLKKRLHYADEVLCGNSDSKTLSTRSNTLHTLIDAYAARKNVALLVADFTESAPRNKLVWNFLTEMLERVSVVVARQKNSRLLFHLYAVQHDKSRAVDLLNPEDTFTEHPIAVGCSPIFGPLMLKATGLHVAPGKAEKIVSKGIKKATLLSSPASWCIVATAVQKTIHASRNDVSLSSFMLMSSPGTAEPFQRALNCVITGETLHNSTNSNGKLDEMHFKRLLGFAVGGPAMTALLSVCCENECPFSASYCMKTSRRVRNATLRGSSVKRFVDCINETLKRSNGTFPDLTQICKETMRQQIKNHVNFLADPLQDTLPLQVPDLPASRDTNTDSKVCERVQEALLSSSHLAAQHVRISPESSNTPSHLRAAPVQIAVPTMVVVSPAISLTEELVVDVEAASLAVVNRKTKKVSIELEAGEVIQLADSQATLDSLVLRNLVEFFVTGHNTGIMIVEGDQSRVKRKLIATAVHLIFERISSDSELHISRVLLKDGEALDLHDEGRCWRDYAFASSPITGPCVHKAQFRALTSASEATKYLTADECDVQQLNEPALWVFSLFLKTFKSDGDVVISSLIITFPQMELRKFRDYLAMEPSNKMFPLFKFALRGPCRTLACFGVTEADTNLTDVLHTMEELTIMRGPNASYGSMQRFAKYIQRILSGETKSTVISPSLAAEILSGVLAFLESPRVVMPPMYVRGGEQ